jgi:hypothetical protein
MPWRPDLARNWKLSSTGHPPSRGCLGERRFSIRRSFVSELKKDMLLIDWLVDEANFAIVTVEGEEQARLCGAHFWLFVSLIYNTRHLFTSLIAVTIGTTPFSANTFPDHPTALR